MINRNIFEDLFVLDMSTSYLDTLERGLRIIHDFSHVVRFNNVRAAIKLPFRDVGNSVQTDYGNAELDCLKETTQVALADADYLRLVRAIREAGCTVTATPFDERSLELCIVMRLPLLEISSSRLNDWPLLEKIAGTGKPVVLCRGDCL